MLPLDTPPWTVFSSRVIFFFSVVQREFRCAPWPWCVLHMVKPVRTPVVILGSLGVCIYVPASRHWLISYSPIHLN